MRHVAHGTEWFCTVGCEGARRAGRCVGRPRCAHECVCVCVCVCVSLGLARTGAAGRWVPARGAPARSLVWARVGLRGFASVRERVRVAGRRGQRVQNNYNNTTT